MLARAGHGFLAVKSDPLLKLGRVSVDGKIATAAIMLRITPGLKIRIDGHPDFGEIGGTNCRVLAWYKPEGELCTRNDPEKGGQPFLIAYRNCAARGGLQ